MEKEDAMKPLIEQLTTMIKEGYDFGKGQIPDIGKQLIHYYLIKNILYVLECVIFSVVCGYLSFRVYQMVMADHSDMDGRWLLLSGLGIASAVSLIISCNFSSEILKIWIAPKVFLLDCLHNYL